MTPTSDDERDRPVVRWGEQTSLAVRNFPISGEPMPAAVVRALAMIKAVAARANADLGVLPPDLAAAVAEAADEVVDGRMADQFPVDVFQTGSGTSTNMNVNEVLAHRASELLGRPVHPNDHVNASQSSNDAFPSAVRIAVALGVETSLLPALQALHRTLRTLSILHADTVKLGRTHLVDALPMTFGQEVSGWARGIELGVERLAGPLPRLCELPLGGTAVGTGLNAPSGFGELVARGLSERTGLALTEATNHFEAQSMQDALVETSAALRSVAITLHKVAGDLRLLGSGPRGGLAEVRIPELQAGSSIMPGKVNPVIPEVVQQVAAQVVGNDATVAFASTSSTLELNTAMPVMARNLLSSVQLLASSTAVFDARCVRGVEPDTARMRDLAERSPALVTALAPRLGYDAAARLAKRMMDRGESLTEALEAERPAGVADVDVMAVARPHHER